MERSVRFLFIIRNSLFIIQAFYRYHKNLNLLNLSLISTSNKRREMNIAENIDIKTPSARVKANPLTRLALKKYKTAQVKRVEILESRMDGQARANPSRTACPAFLPNRDSSRIRAKIRILASTAMPIDKINPTMPAKVSVTDISLKRARARNV